jgi:hypothetical protein
VSSTDFDPGREFDRQFDNLIAKGYPALTGLDADALGELVAPLRAVATARTAAGPEPAPGRAPFIIVLSGKLAPPAAAIAATSLPGRTRQGFVDRHYPDGDLDRFQPIRDVAVPDGDAYLVFDVDRGEEALNVAPDAAMASLANRARTPLTIEEGIAFITHQPAALEKNRCFSLGASRCGDRRVPALWISNGAPKLGWCWGGNPHTWLGLASCAGRAGAY